METCECGRSSRLCARNTIFLFYINDLAEGLVSGVRLFADDTSLFSIVYDEQVSTDILNANLNL